MNVDASMGSRIPIPFSVFGPPSFSYQQGDMFGVKSCTVTSKPCEASRLIWNEKRSDAGDLNCYIVYYSDKVMAVKGYKWKILATIFHVALYLN